LLAALGLERAARLARGGRRTGQGLCNCLENRSPVLFDFEIPVIETYRQLMGVAVVVAIIATAVRLMRKARRANLRFAKRGAQRRFERAPMSADAALPKSDMPMPVQRLDPARRLGDADRYAFDRLATLIDGVHTRAAQLSETQSKAALKLDTAEMAVHRLLADIDGIMTVPRAAGVAAPAAADTAAPRATIAA
jgi:hypothetical protein